MNYNAKSIRPFIGAKDFQVSQRFYSDIGFEEVILSPGFSYFRTGDFGFYLQDAYVQQWIDNTMVFMEVDSVDRCWTALQELDLPARYEHVKTTAIRNEAWGKEYFVHDPSGVLWHFGEFHKTR